MTGKAAAFLILALPWVLGVPATGQDVTIAADRGRIEISGAVRVGTLEVRQVGGTVSGALFGKVRLGEAGATFIPSAPLLAGGRYRLLWQTPAGEERSAAVECPAMPAPAPLVQFAPGVALPANALKFYLHFTQPMEQGVFLEYLRLVDVKIGGREVVGPFRETELWSPDGRRLTVWLHPGRQKTGVNLNVDEGPVLREQGRYRLVVSGKWRSSTGAEIGDDCELEFRTRASDHEMPRMLDWKLNSPIAGTREAFHVRFDKPLDSALIGSAIWVERAGNAMRVAGRVDADPDGEWANFVPAEPWQRCDHILCSDPELEDLAGNSLIKPFEVDLSAQAVQPGPTRLRFSVN